MPLIGTKIDMAVSSFSAMVQKDCLVVDKTLMIKDFINGPKVSLITRPRRFGKTLNLSMLHHFFAAEIDNEPTQGLFHHLAIAREVDAEGHHYIETYQGQYPVISITFKDVKEKNYNRAFKKIKSLIQALYDEHQDCLQSYTLSETNKAKLHKYLGLPNAPET